MYDHRDLSMCPDEILVAAAYQCYNNDGEAVKACRNCPTNKYVRFKNDEDCSRQHLNAEMAERFRSIVASRAVTPKDFTKFTVNELKEAYEICIRHNRDDCRKCPLYHIQEDGLPSSCSPNLLQNEINRRFFAAYCDTATIRIK